MARWHEAFLPRILSDTFKDLVDLGFCRGISV
jgi:hypothetical protein